MSATRIAVLPIAAVLIAGRFALALDRERHAHASADAQRCKPTLGVPLLHFMQKGH
jgi:hypothetical protein